MQQHMLSAGSLHFNLMIQASFHHYPPSIITLHGPPYKKCIAELILIHSNDSFNLLSIE